MAILKGPFIDNNTGDYLYPQTSLDMIENADKVVLKEDIVDPMLATEIGFPADAKQTGDAISELNEKIDFQSDKSTLLLEGASLSRRWKSINYKQ